MQNLRSSRETELVEQFPAHVVAYWMNHSTRIAQKHYLQVTDEHYHRATSCKVSDGEQTLVPETRFVGAQVGATSHVLASQSPTPALVEYRLTLENKAFCDSDRQATTHKMPQVGDEGLELLPFSTGSRAICVERDAESDAYLHEKVVVEQFKLFQPLFSTNLKQALISELVGSLVEG
mgnify:CR=1 FL=1